MFRNPLPPYPFPFFLPFRFHLTTPSPKNVYFPLISWNFTIQRYHIYHPPPPYSYLPSTPSPSPSFKYDDIFIFLNSSIFTFKRSSFYFITYFTTITTTLVKKKTNTRFLSYKCLSIIIFKFVYFLSLTKLQ